MSTTEQLQLLPADQWYTERPRQIDLYHPFTNPNMQPGQVDYNSNPVAEPTAFRSDTDWFDGMDALRGSTERSEGRFNISVLLTDPARPDGFDRESLKYAVDEFGMIVHASTRSAYHSIRQHGASPDAGGAKLGDPRPHEDYQGNLDEVLRQSGKPHYSYDPSIKLHTPSQRLALGVQEVRDITYAEARKQKNMTDPNFAFFVPDMVNTNTMQWLQVGILGLKMQEHVDEHNYGDLPENLLVIAPADQSAIIHKLGMVTRNPDILADVALTEIGEDSYMRDQYMHAYAANLQEGNIELPAQN